jgi:hypothetical protein
MRERERERERERIFNSKKREMSRQNISKKVCWEKLGIA